MKGMFLFGGYVCCTLKHQSFPGGDSDVYPGIPSQPNKWLGNWSLG